MSPVQNLLQLAANIALPLGHRQLFWRSWDLGLYQIASKRVLAVAGSTDVQDP